MMINSIPFPPELVREIEEQMKECFKQHPKFKEFLKHHPEFLDTNPTIDRFREELEKIQNREKSSNDNKEIEDE